MFLKFDEYLNLDLPNNYWYDIGILDVAEIVGKFQAADWQALAAAIGNRSAQWRTRCAEIVDASESEFATQILLTLLTAQEKDVVIAAADSLRGRDLSEIVMPEKALAQLREIMASGAPPVNAVLGDFFARLKP